MNESSPPPRDDEAGSGKKRHDEPSVLEGLRRSLLPLRHEWDPSFAGSGREALQTMSEATFEVIVTDLRMPEMDGAELLSEVARRHPEVAHIILTGGLEWKTMPRTAGLNPVRLWKPCDVETLRAAVTHVCPRSGE